MELEKAYQIFNRRLIKDEFIVDRECKSTVIIIAIVLTAMTIGVFKGFGVNIWSFVVWSILTLLMVSAVIIDILRNRYWLTETIEVPVKEYNPRGVVIENPNTNETYLFAIYDRKYDPSYDEPVLRFEKGTIASVTPILIINHHNVDDPLPSRGPRG